MTDFARLVLVSDTTGLTSAQRELRQLTSEGSKTERALTTSTQKMGRAYRTVAVAVAGMASALVGASAALRSSQEIVGIANGLRAMGMSTREAEAALSDIADVALRTRAPLRETAELYRRVSTASKDMGASQADVLRFTENVGLALAASGTSANEASGALLQLSQAMAGGVVRAEEFNSILEGAFPIAQAAANGIDRAGGSVGRLRALVVEGEISSREFFESIISQTDALEDAFGRTVPTIAQAMTVLATSVGLVAFGFDDAVGVSEFFASAILNVAQGVTWAADAIGSAKSSVDQFLSGILPLGGEVDSFRVLLTGAAAVVTGMYVPAIVGATLSTAAWIYSLVTLRGALIATGIGALVVGAGLLIDFLLRLRSATGSWGEALSALGDLAAGVWEGIKTSASSLSPALGAVWETIKAGFYTMLAGIQTRWADFLHDVVGGMQNVGAVVPGMEDMILAVHGAAVTAGSGVHEFNSAAEAATAAAAGLKGEAASLATAGFDKARDALARLQGIMAQNGDETTEAADAARDLTKELDNVAESAGGAGGAAEKVKELTQAQKDAQTAAEQVERTFESTFVSFVTGAKSAKNAIGELLGQLAKMAANAAFKGMFGGSKGFDILGSIFGGGGGGGGITVPQNVLAAAASFDGGGYTGGGSRSGGLDGKGGFMAMLHPRETVVDHTKGQTMQGGDGRTIIELRMSPDVEARVLEKSAEQSVQITQAGLDQFSGETFTNLSNAARAEPRLKKI